MAHNGLEQIDVEGQNVLIIGAGPIGLLATSVAKAMGEKQTDKQTDRQRKKESIASIIFNFHIFSNQLNIRFHHTIDFF